MITLYEAANELAQLMDSFDPETGELSPEFEQARAIVATKSRAVVAYIKSEESNIVAAKLYVEELQKRIASSEKRQKWLKNYLAEHMSLCGVTKITDIETNGKLFSATLYPERDESVEIEDGATFPPELCFEPKPPTPSKLKIKDAILAGEPVSGARIVRKDRLIIR